VDIATVIVITPTVMTVENVRIAVVIVLSRLAEVFLPAVIPAACPAEVFPPAVIVVACPAEVFPPAVTVVAPAEVLRPQAAVVIVVYPAEVLRPQAAVVIVVYPAEVFLPATADSPFDHATLSCNVPKISASIIKWGTYSEKEVLVLAIPLTNSQPVRNVPSRFFPEVPQKKRRKSTTSSPSCPDVIIPMSPKSTKW